MAAKHTFNQAEVLVLGFTKLQKDLVWAKFQDTCSELGHKISITGGNFITHEVSCSKDDFEFILEWVAA